MSTEESRAHCQGQRSLPVSVRQTTHRPALVRRTHEGRDSPPRPSQQSCDAGVRQPVPRQTRSLRTGPLQQSCPHGTSLDLWKGETVLAKDSSAAGCLSTEGKRQAWKAERELKDFGITSDVQNCHSGLRQRLSSGPALGTKNLKTPDL